MAIKQTSDFSNFDKLDIRIGRIIKVEDSLSKKPAYRLTIDFGPDVGIKVSCGAYRNYGKDELTGKLVVGVVNFEPKKMGPETSEVLVLGVQNEKQEIIYLSYPSTDFHAVCAEIVQFAIVKPGAPDIFKEIIHVLGEPFRVVSHDPGVFAHYWLRGAQVFQVIAFLPFYKYQAERPFKFGYYFQRIAVKQAYSV